MALQYKLFISDFDDTLLRSDNTVSERTKTAIKAYTDAGGLFTLSTGRMCKSIMMRLKELGLDKTGFPLIGYQGARIIDSLTGQSLHEANLANKDAIELVKECYRRQLYVQIYVKPERLIVDKHTYMSNSYCQATGVSAEEAGDLVRFLEMTGYDCHKALIIADKSKTLEIMKSLGAVYDNILFNISHPSFVEAVDCKSGKGNAARWLADKMGIGMDRVAGIGDSLNDLPLLKAVGLGIAVANARADLKIHAHRVSRYSNDEDAVARELEQILTG